jgi:hypothetical protein
MLVDCPSVERRVSELVLTISARRMDSGLSLVCTLARDTRRYILICLLLAWLNILAAADGQGIKGGVNGVLLDHYHKYGRTFFSR